MMRTLSVQLFQAENDKELSTYSFEVNDVLLMGEDWPDEIVESLVANERRMIFNCFSVKMNWQTF